MKEYDAFTLTDLLKRDVKRLIPNLVLASSSTERKDILESLGVNVYTTSVSVNEKMPQYGNPIEIATDNALLKLDTFSGEYNLNKVCFPVITADTVVASFLPNESHSRTIHTDIPYEIVGKPRDRQDAFNMLKKLTSEKMHMVVTALAIYIEKNGEVSRYRAYDSAIVEFKNNITDKDIEEYLDTEEWKGTAGAHKIQKKGKKFVKSIYGDINTIRGLGLKSLYEITSAIDSL